MQGKITVNVNYVCLKTFKNYLSIIQTTKFISAGVEIAGAGASQ